MSPKKPTLGRGLADLLGQARLASQGSPGPPDAAASGDAAAVVRARPLDEELAHVPLDLLQRGRYQPRLDMRPETLTELAESIRAQGVVQPIVVRPIGELDARGVQRYEIIAGERRWRAAQQAGLHEIPAVIRQVPDDAAIAMALIENIQREDLNPLEEARALQRLIAEFGLTHQQAADAVGRSRAAVSNLLRLLELPPEVCERWRNASWRWAMRARCSVCRSGASRSKSRHSWPARACRCARPRAWCGAWSSRRSSRTRPRGKLPLIRTFSDLRRAGGETGRAGEHRARPRRATDASVIRYHSLDELDGILSTFQHMEFLKRASLRLYNRARLSRAASN
jgi:ParB family chromosome partitioning protein